MPKSLGEFFKKTYNKTNNKCYILTLIKEINEFYLVIFWFDKIITVWAANIFKPIAIYIYCQNQLKIL